MDPKNLRFVDRSMTIREAIALLELRDDVALAKRMEAIVTLLERRIVGATRDEVLDLLLEDASRVGQSLACDLVATQKLKDFFAPLKGH